MHSIPRRNKLRFVQRLLGDNELKYAVLLVKSDCNMICPYCRVQEQRLPELSTENWFQAIDCVERWGASHFNILGGEPLLRPDIAQLVNYIANKGLGVTLTTNGLLLTEETIKQLALSGLLMLIVSVDKLSGGPKGNFDQAIQKLQCARRFGIVPVLHAVITSLNVSEAATLAKATTDHGVFFSCSLYQRVGGAQSRTIDRLVPRTDAVLAFFDELAQIKRHTGLVKTSYRYMEDYREYADSIMWKCDSDVTRWIAIQSDGHLMVCAEWSTPISIFSSFDTSCSEWACQKKQIVNSCSGCYYECYYSEQQVFTPRGLIREIPIGLAFWKTALELLARWVYGISGY